MNLVPLPSWIMFVHHSSQNYHVVFQFKNNFFCIHYNISFLFNTMDTLFFSKNNFELLFNIVANQILKKYHVNVTEEHIFRENLYDIMKNVHNEKIKYLSPEMLQKSDKEQVKELSKHVLVIAVQYFSKIIDLNQKKQADDQCNTEQTLPDRPKSLPPSHVEGKPADLGEPNKDAQFRDVNAEYARITEERKRTLSLQGGQHADRLPESGTEHEFQFGDNSLHQGLELQVQASKGFSETSAASSQSHHIKSLNNQVRSINQQAEKQSRTVPVPTNMSRVDPNGEASLFSGKGEESESNFASQFSILGQDESLLALQKQFDGGNIQERLKNFEKERAASLNVSLKDQSVANTVTPILSQDTSAFGSAENNTESKTPETTSTPGVSDSLSSSKVKTTMDPTANFHRPISVNHVFDEQKYTTRTRQVVINSLDRPWYGHIDSDGVVHESLFTERHKYTVSFNGESDTSSLSIQENFKNIVKAQFKRIILPRHYKILSNDLHRQIRGNDGVANYARKMLFYGPKNFPYLLIHVNEFDSQIVSTNKQHKSIFCKAYYDKETSEFRWLDWNKHYMRGVTFYTNKDMEAALYTHNPISQLSKLSIEIQNDRGVIFDNTKDDLKIKSIIIDNTSDKHTSTISIQLTTFIDKYYFRQNDKIICKLYNLKPEYRELQDFLEAGTTVLDVFVLKTPGVMNDEIGYNGGFDKINWIRVQNKMKEVNTYTEVKYYEYEFLDDPELEDNIPDETPMGFLISAQMQHSMVLEITERIPENQPSSLLT